jgi:hypothetical protein
MEIFKITFVPERVRLASIGSLTGDPEDNSILDTSA